MSMDSDNQDRSKTDRRTFLKKMIAGGGGVMALASCDFKPEDIKPENGAQITLPANKDPKNFIIHGESPLNIETQRDRFGSGMIVPNELFYVRSNLPLPDPSILENRDAWKLKIEGVANEREISVGELKRLGLKTVAVVIQCSGNGRQFFEHDASGSQWQVGAAGCSLWSGVPVRTVANHLGGVRSDAKFMTGTGGEEIPDGLNRDDVVMERSVPVDKGIDDAILAWEMNGTPVPLPHGGPLRLIIPGYYGCNQIKYIKRLAFTPEESKAKVQQTGYRVRPIGESGSPGQPSMWEMNVKSWINHPAGNRTYKSGTLQIHGVAFAGEERVERVEVSTDGGITWTEAGFTGPDMGRHAWRQFVLESELTPGNYQLASRATGENGSSQPENRFENERGYGNNSWRDHMVEITVV